MTTFRRLTMRVICLIGLVLFFGTGEARASIATCRVGEEVEVVVRCASATIEPLAPDLKRPADVVVVSKNPIKGAYDYRLRILPRRACELDLRECLEWPASEKANSQQGDFTVHVTSTLSPHDSGQLAWSNAPTGPGSVHYNLLLTIILTLWLAAIPLAVLRNRWRARAAGPKPIEMPAGPDLETQLESLGQRIIAGTSTLEDHVAFERVALAISTDQRSFDAAGLKELRSKIDDHSGSARVLRLLDAWLYRTGEIDRAGLQALLAGNLQSKGESR